MTTLGVQVNQLDGNLGIQPGSNTNIITIMGPSIGGTPGTQYSLGDPVTAANTLLGGELLEEVIYALNIAKGATVNAIPLSASTQGGVGSVTQTGSGAMTVTPTIAPWGTVTFTVGTGGALGTMTVTPSITLPNGTVITLPPVLSASSWSSTGYVMPNSYVTVVFAAGTYVAADTYVISTKGAVTHTGSGSPANPTFTASPVDFYRLLITVIKGGAVGTSQITYSLDNGNNTSAVLTTAASYAIPGTGIVLALSGTANAGDTYSFVSAGPASSDTDLGVGLTAIETTLLALQTESLIGVIGSVASASAWATRVALLEAAAVTLAGSNVFVRFLCGGPTVGTVLQNSGSVTVDSADTDSVVITARAGMSAPHVCVCAGDGFMVSPSTQLQFRRNSVWAAMARAVAVAASQDIGAEEDGGVLLFTSAIRNDFAQGYSFFNAGITSLYASNSGPVFINQGLMGTVSTSDYYSLTNARVVDRASAIGYNALRPYKLKKLPTMTRGSLVGTVREDAAKKIDSKVTQALQSGMVTGQPKDAVAAIATTVRTNNLYATKQLIVNGSVQPFGYPTAIIFNVGMTVQAS